MGERARKNNMPSFHTANELGEQARKRRVFGNEAKKPLIHPCSVESRENRAFRNNKSTRWGKKFKGTMERRERERITRNSKQPLPILKERSKGERFELAASFFSQASSERGRTRVKWSGGWKNKRRNVAQKWTPGFLAREYFNSTRKIRLVRLSFIFRHPFSPYRCGRVTWFSYRSQFSLHLVSFSSSFHLLLVSIFFDIVK